jgi:hypothetical protein
MPEKDVRERVLYLDDEVIKGAFYVATAGSGSDGSARKPTRTISWKLASSAPIR